MAIPYKIRYLPTPCSLLPENLIGVDHIKFIWIEFHVLRYIKSVIVLLYIVLDITHLLFWIVITYDRYNISSEPNHSNIVHISFETHWLISSWVLIPYVVFFPELHLSCEIKLVLDLKTCSLHRHTLTKCIRIPPGGLQSCIIGC